jgi:hypothetical protein
MGSHQLQRGSSTDLLTGVGAGAMFVHHSALPVRSEAALRDAREAVRVVVRAEAAIRDTKWWRC